MIKVYAVALVVGVVALIAVVFRSTISDHSTDPKVRTALGAVLGFAMGGIAAEYSPLDLSWPVALVLALVAAAAAVLWVRYASRQEG